MVSLPDDNEMFRPPVNRLMRVLDRSFFQKAVPTSAAKVFNHKDISRFRRQLEQTDEILNIPNGRRGIPNILPDPEPGSSLKCVILQPRVKHDGM